MSRLVRTCKDWGAVKEKGIREERRKMKKGRERGKGGGGGGGGGGGNKRQNLRRNMD